MPFNFHYVIAFHTANENGAGTDVDIKLNLFGTNSNSDEFAVSGENRLSERDCGFIYCEPLKVINPFEKGSVTYFTHDTNTFYGDLTKLQLRVEDDKPRAQDNPAWRLDYIEITARYSGEEHKWRFDVYSWIGTGKDPYYKEEQKNNIIINVAQS